MQKNWWYCKWRQIYHKSQTVTRPPRGRDRDATLPSSCTAQLSQTPFCDKKSHPFPSDRHPQFGLKVKTKKCHVMDYKTGLVLAKTEFQLVPFKNCELYKIL